MFSYSFEKTALSPNLLARYLGKRISTAKSAAEQNRILQRFADRAKNLTGQSALAIMKPRQLAAQAAVDSLHSLGKKNIIDPFAPAIDYRKFKIKPATTPSLQPMRPNTTQQQLTQRGYSRSFISTHGSNIIQRPQYATIE